MCWGLIAIGGCRTAINFEQLIDAGFGDKIFLSNDWELEREEFNPDAFLFNTRKTIPYLTQLGVSQQQIHAITVENPKRFFARS